FRPNRVEAYRKTALREIERLERRWRQMNYAWGRSVESPRKTDGWPPDLTERIAWLQEQMLGPLPALTPDLTALRERIEAPAPGFDEWVAIRREIERLDDELDRARAIMAPLVTQYRRRDAPWGIAVAPLSDNAPWPGESATLRVPDELELSAARGEVEGAQLVLLGNADPVRIETTPLVGPGGTIPASAIAWYSVEDNRMIPHEPMPPWWQADVHYAGVIGSGSSGRIWWEITIPRDAEAGVYQGEIVTTDGEHRVTLPVELTIHDFTLPKTPSLAVSVGFDGQQVTEAWYGERSPLGAGEYWPYAEALLKHGVVPREMLADFTWWGDDGIDLGGANRMMIRAWDYAPDMRAMIAARPEQLGGLEKPRAALRRAVDHWRKVAGAYPIRTYLPAGSPPPDLGPRQRNNSIAVALPDMALEPIAEIGNWAVAPEIASGFGGCEGVELSLAASEAESAKLWRIAGAMSPMDVRMLGWLADEYRRDMLLWDDAGSGELCASGLLYCADGEQRLVDPHPTVALKLLQQAVQDYEYLRILRGLNSELAPHDIPDRLWRLRLAKATQYQRNWDMVMNVRDFNRDEQYLAQRNARVAEQIMRGRRWMQQVGVKGELPGDAKE
ncbi:MAG: hypothetical protein R6V07_06220, partial [Armatimonadota bacterium]